MDPGEKLEKEQNYYAWKQDSVVARSLLLQGVTRYQLLNMFFLTHILRLLEDILFKGNVLQTYFPRL